MFVIIFMKSVEHLCRRAKIALRLVFLQKIIAFLLSHAVV